ncbi:MAG: sigma-54-dependent transcriptional regulator [Candidatus Acidulodesulfobacterium sp.]
MNLPDMKSVNILIVEDDDASRNGLSEYFNLKGYKVFSADRIKSAFEILNYSAESENNKDKIDIIITDLKLPDGTGLELLKSIKEGLNQNAEVIIATGFSSVKTAVEAIKLGAYDYITKPVNLEELELLVSRIISNKNLIDELNILKNRLDEKYNFGNLITSSRKMIETVDTAISVSGTNSTVLIEGESGTGKELLANIIVNNSKRKNKPFVKVNCAALSETVLENELFGHEKGAYTGADSLYKGRFEIADGGTIFLDEIGEISLKTQTKILRVLQEREFERVGGSKTIKVDIRIIAASQDITKKVSNGEFRKDLYYRLNVINLNLIPLRERREDVPLLVKRFLSDFAEENGKKFTGLNKEVLDILLNYDYPGNVRELKNIVEYMTAVSKNSVIDESSIPDYLKKINKKKETGSDSGGKDFIKIPFGIGLEDAENIIIKKTLERNGFNKVKTANDLKIGLKTVYRKLEKI